MPFTIRPHARFPVTCFLGFMAHISLLILSSGTAYAEWIALEKQYQSPGLRTVYIDSATIRREGDQVTLWQLTDYQSTQGNVGMGGAGFGPHRFFSTVTQKQFDCPNKRLRLLTFTEFSSHMGTGVPNDGYVDQDKWLTVEPEGLNQGLWEMACDKP